MFLIGISKRISKLEHSRSKPQKAVFVGYTLTGQWLVVINARPSFHTLADALGYVQDGLGITDIDVYDLSYNIKQLPHDEFTRTVDTIKNDQSTRSRIVAESDQLQQARQEYPHLRLNHVILT